jgi:uncharacterized protein
MGHCHPPTQFGSHGRFLEADRGVAGASAGARGFSQVAARERGIGAWLLLFLVRFYQIFLGPFFGGNCKFYPSCSHYALEAIERHGAWRGFVLAMKRLGRCRPFTRGGFDPVPDAVAEESGRSRRFAKAAQGRPFEPISQGKPQ